MKNVFSTHFTLYGKTELYTHTDLKKIQKCLQAAKLVLRNIPKYDEVECWIFATKFKFSILREKHRYINLKSNAVKHVFFTKTWVRVLYFFFLISQATIRNYPKTSLFPLYIAKKYPSIQNMSFRVYTSGSKYCQVWPHQIFLHFMGCRLELWDTDPSLI